MGSPSIYAHNCSPCHGTRMQNPEAAFDLRTFPPDEHERIVSSVTNGKNQMPPWGDLLDGEDIESLWAYVERASGGNREARSIIDPRPGNNLCPSKPSSVRSTR
jgi:mono/diheme cytochrome c family protein